MAHIEIEPKWPPEHPRIVEICACVTLRDFVGWYHAEIMHTRAFHSP